MADVIYHGTALAPNMQYTVKVNGATVALSNDSNPTRVSFNSPFNKVDVTLKAISNQPSYCEARITKASADWDLFEGNLIAESIFYTPALNTTYSYSFNINSTLFNKGDGDYRVSLYAKSALDGAWDVQAVFLVSGGGLFIPYESNGIEVYKETEIN